MEKLLFKKIELWLVGLLFLIAFLGAVLFGAIVRNVAQGKDRFGKLGEIAYAIASVPEELKDLFDYKQDNWMSVGDSSRFEGRSGWNFDATTPEQRPDGYILFSRYDGDIKRHVIELVDLKAGTVEHRIELDAAGFLGDWRPVQENDIATPWIPERYRGIHPYVLPGGDLLFKDHFSPLVRLTPCGQTVFSQDSTEFHHSLEPGLDGTFWAPTRMPLQAFDNMGGRIRNMGIAQFDADGNLLYERSLGDLFLENGYEYLMVDVRDFDFNPMHLNDVEPVLEDGPYWKRGDVFLSFRRLSAIMLFRPSTDEIIWLKRGPWRAQHDVDILNDHMIAVYNNDVINTGDGPRVRDHNKVTTYDFANGEVANLFDDVLAESEVRATFGGLFSLLPDGGLMVEETTEGRLLIFDADGRAVVENVNRAGDDRIYYLGWSRYLDREQGDRARDAFRAAGCDV